MTHMVNAAFAGDDEAVSEVWARVYDELHTMARHLMGGRWSGAVHESLPATAMVHELFLKLHRKVNTQWDSRAHFFGACARAMEQLLIDHHRARTRLKRGGGKYSMPLSRAGDALAVDPDAPTDTDLEIRLIEAIGTLEQCAPRSADVARLRCVVGLSNVEIARVHEVTTRTVQNDWRFAKAWLQQRLSQDGEANEP
jgi:RNA polymerase sigma factor (TIGR02999 family)